MRGKGSDCYNGINLDKERKRTGKEEWNLHEKIAKSNLGIIVKW